MLRFLDRFMYRNPKKKETERGSSVMQVFLIYIYSHSFVNNLNFE